MAIGLKNQLVIVDGHPETGGAWFSDTRVRGHFAGVDKLRSHEW